MSFLVEDGSGLPAANSYAAVADADSYATDRGNSAWGGLSTGVKQAALIDASLYIDANFEFVGNKVSYAQGMSWPRQNVYDVSEQVTLPSNIVPSSIKRSVMELAIKSSAGTVLLEDLAFGGAVKSETVGPISVTYRDDAMRSTLYMITGLLKGLVKSRDPSYAPNVVSPNYSADQYFGPGQFDNKGSGLSTGGS